MPIISKKDLEKKTVSRGHTDVLYKDDQILVAWKDNKGFYMASNKFDADTTNNCRRFCRTERKYVTVPIPTMVQRYNTGMGGVDLWTTWWRATVSRFASRNGGSQSTPGV